MPNSETKPTIGPVIIDLETNGLRDEATHIHCVAVYYVEDGRLETYNDECPGKGMSSPVVRAVQDIEMADTIIGHNIINFDLPIIKKLYPFFNPSGNVVDTLLLSRLFHPNLFEIDKRNNWKHMPLQLHGRHSLEAYGYRLNEYKGNFAKMTDWKEWSQEMEDYCKQDVVVTKKLCEHFRPYMTGSKWSIK